MHIGYERIGFIGLLRMEAYWLKKILARHALHFLLYYSLMEGLTLSIALHCIASYTNGKRDLTSCTVLYTGRRIV